MTIAGIQSNLKKEIRVEECLRLSSLFLMFMRYCLRCLQGERFRLDNKLSHLNLLYDSV